MGSMLGKLGVYIALFAPYLFMINSALFRKLPNIDAKKLNPAIAFSSAYYTFLCISMTNNKSLSILDFIEFLYPVFFLINVYYFKNEKIIKPSYNKLLKITIGVQVVMYAVTIGIFFGFLSLGKIYGLSTVFNEGYGKFRSFGVAGQPGVQGTYNIIFFTLNVALYRSKNLSFKLFIFLSFLNIVATILTGSRIAIGITTFLLLFLSLLDRKCLVIFAIGLVIFIPKLLDSDILQMLARGSSNLNIATLIYRLEYKIQVLTMLNMGIFDSLIGIGPSKDWLGQHYSRLRHPDSLHTVYLIRFGLLGSSVIILFLLITLYSMTKYFWDRILFLLVTALLFLEPSVLDVRVLFLYTFATYFMCLQNNPKRKFFDYKIYLPAGKHRTTSGA